jgi:hypothetical protein
MLDESMLAQANYRSFFGLDKLLDYFAVVKIFISFLAGLFSNKKGELISLTTSLNSFSA